MKRKYQNYLKILKKSSYKFSGFLFVALLLVACSSDSKKLDTKKIPLSVDITSSRDSKTESLIIEKDSAGKTVGPVPTTPYNNQLSGVTKSGVHTLLLGPGIYRTFAYLPLLKKIKSENVPIHVIGGYGLASVIATYYAFGFEPDLIEWKLFTNLIKKSKPYPFDKSWIETVFKLIEKDFQNKKIEDSKISLFIPAYKDKKISFATRGQLVPLLKNNLLINNAAGLNKLMSKNPCENKGVSRIIRSSRIICMNVLDYNLKWLSAKDYILGIYNKASSLMENDSSESKININLKNLELDNLSKQPEILSRSKEQSDEIIQKIFNYLNYN